MTDLDKAELLDLKDVGDARLRGFAPAEMVTCESCLRANPPTRAACMYCGEQLPAAKQNDAVQAEPHVKSADPAADFYVVLAAAANERPDKSRLQQIAVRSGSDVADLQAVLEAGSRLPLFKVNTRAQADQLVDEFRELAIKTISLKDEDLGSSLANKKIRALEFCSAGVTGFVGLSGEQVFENWTDLILLVVGRLQINNVEDVTRPKHGEQEPVDRRELINDQSVIDLYSRSNSEGWRIIADSFDFSCLGERKGITAFENFSALIDLFRERAENIEVTDSYFKVRSLLEQVWPPRVDTRTGGWRRSGGSKFEISTVTSTDNEPQFTNYSRMLRCLRMREFMSQEPDR